MAPVRPSERMKLWLPRLGLLVLVLILGWGIWALQSRPPVEFTTLSGDALGYDDGSWDHFEAIAVPPRTSRAELQELLEWLRLRYTRSPHDRVYILIFNDRMALLMANENALVAEYRQDRSRREFIKELLR